MRATGRRVLLSMAATVALLITGTPQAGADDLSFYDPPSPLPSGANGEVLRTEPADFFLDPAKLTRAPAEVNRIMYLSTDTRGAQIPVTGTVLTPHTPWIGVGERPVVAYAAGTQGVDDACAPSRAAAAGLEYEGLFIAGLLARGYAVTVTDYEGLGTPGMHTYMNRLSQGHAVLDSIRAAQQLPEADLPDGGPVAIAGYSQGGGAAASAAELASTYAPELDLKGTYAGAPPADLGKVATFLDGKYAAGFVGYALSSLDSAYPELKVREMLNDEGNRRLDTIASKCMLEVLATQGFVKSTDISEDGRPLAAYLAEEPYKSVVAEQKIGTIAPKAPTLVIQSLFDDIVEPKQGKQMVDDWCDKGATVKYTGSYVPTHIAGAVRAFPEAFGWLEARFAGLPAPNSCG